MFRQMKYFISVVKNNSFTLAAEECYISQSAISQQIQSLEEDLGVQLIIRENRSFTLTKAGEYFYRQGLILLEEVERLRIETTRIAKNGKRILRIGYLNGYNGQELSQAISDFSERVSDLDIQIVSGNHEELSNLLYNNTIQISLNDQRRAFSDTYFNYHLYTSLCYIEISTRSPLASLKTVTMDELKRVPCIIISSKSQREQEQDFYRTYLGFTGDTLFADNIEEARLLVSANKGFFPIQATGSIPQAGVTLERIPLYQDGKQVERSYYAFWPKARTSSDIEKFADLLYEKFNKQE